MTAFYVPILKAKTAEFTALAHVADADAASTLPLMEIPRFPAQRAKFKQSSTPITDYLDEVIEYIAESWAGRTLMIDPRLWSPEATTESGEHVVPYVCKALQEEGVVAYPVINSDLWDSAPYRRALGNVDIGSQGFYCIRLDKEAISDAVDEDHFNEILDQIVSGLGVPESSFSVLLDMGDLTRDEYDETIGSLSIAINLLEDRSFRFVITAGCTIPASINEAVRKQNSTGYVDRTEISAWKYCHSSYPRLTIAFGDYGVRNPNSKDGTIAPDANGKIRYTIPDQYFVVRGYSRRIGAKGAQLHELCRTLIASDHYLGADFSWGDSEILACANRDTKPGNLTSWIAIDTSHHIAEVVAEIHEFDRISAGVEAEPVSK